MKKIFSALVALTLIASLNACNKSETASDEAIKNYILKHPEVLVESLTNYQKSQMEGGTKMIEDEVKKRSDAVYNNPASPVVGNPNGKTVIVEFFDYNCHFCKGVLPDVKKVIAENKDVKVIFKEVPFLGASSATTAVAALAVYDMAPAKYFAFHTSLMEHQGAADDNAITAAALKAGIDPGTLAEKIKDKKYSKFLDDNMQLAQALHIDGTPTFIINGHVARGAIRYEKMKAMINGASE